MESNRDYCKRRAAEEGQAAAAASCKAARDAHHELQTLFLGLARSGGELSIFLVDPQPYPQRDGAAVPETLLAVDPQPEFATRKGRGWPSLSTYSRHSG